MFNKLFPKKKAAAQAEVPWTQPSGMSASRYPAHYYPDQQYRPNEQAHREKKSQRGPYEEQRSRHRRDPKLANSIDRQHSEPDPQSSMTGGLQQRTMSEPCMQLDQSEVKARLASLRAKIGVEDPRRRRRNSSGDKIGTMSPAGQSPAVSRDRRASTCPGPVNAAQEERTKEPRMNWTETVRRARAQEEIRLQKRQQEMERLPQGEDGLENGSAPPLESRTLSMDEDEEDSPRVASTFKAVVIDKPVVGQSSGDRSRDAIASKIDQLRQRTGTINLKMKLEAAYRRIPEEFQGSSMHRLKKSCSESATSGKHVHFNESPVVHIC